MPGYTFDIHADGASEWGEKILDGAGREAIERQTRELIADAQERQRARGEAAPLTTVFVHREDDGIVLTAYGRPGEPVRMVWAPG